MHSPTAHPLGITSLSISPLANRSLSNSIDGTTLLHSLATGQLLGTHQSFLKTSSSATASSWTVAIHPEEKIFASSGAGGKVVLREARVVGDEGFEAEAVGWGEEKRVLETGRDKFGMDLKYVSVYVFLTVFLSRFEGGRTRRETADFVFRPSSRSFLQSLPTVVTSPSPATPDPSSSLTSKPVPS